LCNAKSGLKSPLGLCGHYFYRQRHKNKSQG
jgi:hypothetical protein